MDKLECAILGMIIATILWIIASYINYREKCKYLESIGFELRMYGHSEEYVRNTEVIDTYDLCAVSLTELKSIYK